MMEESSDSGSFEPPSFTFSYLMICEAARIFEARYSTHLDKSLLVTNFMEKLGFKPGFSAASQLLRNSKDLLQTGDFQMVGNFLLTKLAPMIFDSPNLTGKWNLSKGLLSFRFNQSSMSPVFRLLGAQLSENQQIVRYSSKTSTDGEAFSGIQLTASTGNTSFFAQVTTDPSKEEDPSNIEFWILSLGSFYGGVFSGALLHLGYRAEFQKCRVKRSTIGFLFSVQSMEPPYTIPSTF